MNVSRSQYQHQCSSRSRPPSRQVTLASTKRQIAGETSRQQQQQRPQQHRNGSQQQEENQQQVQQRKQLKGDDAESRHFRRALRFPKYELPPVDPSDPDYEGTRKGEKQQLLQELEQQYGPHYSDADVRLYLKKRQLNANRRRVSRRGGIPLDDSFDRPGTFLKFSPDFQRTVLTERCTALIDAMPQLPFAAAWQLYSTIPGLLTYMTMEVTHRLHSFSHSTGLHVVQLVQQLCALPRLAFLAPVTVESRLGLFARLAGLERRRAVLLMFQHPQLWLMSSKLLGPRAEELALVLGSCTVTALKLLGSCPQLLSVDITTAQQQLATLCSLLGTPSTAPAVVVPLLLARPDLLLLPAGQTRAAWEQQQAAAAAAGTGGSRAASVGGYQCNPVQQVGQQLGVLQDALQLPANLVQQMVLHTPELLELASRNSSSTGATSSTAAPVEAAGSGVAAAVDVLAHSWMCTAGAAEARQRYQQQLLHLLRPPVPQQHTKKQKRYKQQLQQAKGLHQQQQQQPRSMIRYIAADVLAYTAASCQWWAGNSNMHVTHKKSALQQLLVQAPALLVLAAATHTPAAAAQPATGDETAAATPEVAARATTGLDLRLHSLCQQLLTVIAQQQEQQEQQEQDLQQQQKQQKQYYATVMQQARSASVLEPQLLAQPPSFVAHQLQQLSRVLRVAPAGLWQLLAEHCPAVLWLNESQVYERIRVLCGVMRLPAQQVRERLLKPDVLPVLLLEPEKVKRGWGARSSDAAAAGKVQGGLLTMLHEQPQPLPPGSGAYRQM